jgi:hypothetical protein
MAEERLVNLVLVSLDSEDPGDRQVFVQKMSEAFSVPTDQIEKILRSLPFTLSRKCTIDEARGMAEKIQVAGGICRMMDPEDEPAPPPAPEAATPTSPSDPPAAEPPAAPSAPAGGGGGSIPLATEGSIPLASSGGGGSAPAGADSVRCIECGEVQPRGGDSCRNCYYPLPAK